MLRGSMVSALLRMLLAFALVLAPAGMTGLSAAAEAPVISSHCTDHPGPQRTPADGKWHCATCAAIPAQDAPEPAHKPAAGVGPTGAADHPTTGLEPEVATPPPR